MTSEVGGADAPKQVARCFYPTFWLMRACYPHLKENQGSVINFASGSG